MGVLGDPALEARLAALHGASDTQAADMRRQFEANAGAMPGPAEIKTYLADKMVALDRDKSEFAHQLIRAMGAKRVVEIGTSFGVSTLYLAAAVRENIAAGGGAGLVVGTEYEPAKAEAARSLFAEAGLASLIDLREGDLRETLKSLEGPIDFMLMDIWIDMATPALELVAPHMRVGAVILTDNTQAYRDGYAPYFTVLARQGFSTLTLPFEGGFEMSVKGGAA